MSENQEVETRKRRSRGEVKRLVAEFGASGIQRNEFFRTGGIALSTLQRHLKRHGSGVGRAVAPWLETILGAGFRDAEMKAV
jgi:hypothetical protein